MDSIQQQVASARRRLNSQRFLHLVPWTLFAALLVAAIAMAIPKIWALEIDPSVWLGWWIGGTVVAGLFVTLVLAYWFRHGTMDAAIELDRRFGLRERVSSALSLPASEQESAAGRALIEDASRRVEAVEVTQAFSMRVGWATLLPLVPALAVFILLLFPDAEGETVEAAPTLSKENQQIKRSFSELDKRLAKRQKENEAKGLDQMDDLIMKIREGVDDLAAKKDTDRHQAMIKLNDLAKQLQQRRDAIGDPERMKRQLERLKNLENGPAERALKALKAGNVQKALDELSQLTEKIRNGKVSPEDQKQLMKQLKEVQQKLQEMVDAHEQAKKNLERQIQQKMSEGDLESAGKLQRKLDQLEKADRQMKRMEDLASRFGNACESLKSGDTQGAASELDAMMADLQDMQSEMGELETISEFMDEISNCKNSMMCDMCDGEGCSACQGGFNPFGNPGNGDGLGEGMGYGDRPEQETDTSFYESRLRAKPRPGEAVRIGDAAGPNQPGMSYEEVKDAIANELREESDPLSDQRLPRSQQDHVRQYYQRLNK